MGGTGLNETLCRALLRARLTEEDVATHLQVDPKTVRRWLEGRVPYLRHRWAIATMLGLDETDLWPQLRSARSRPDEVHAIYPHLDAVPEDVWIRLFGSAEREIGILADSAQPIAAYPRALAVLVEKAAGVGLRICLPDLHVIAVAQRLAAQEDNALVAAQVHEALANFGPMREKGHVEIRLHPAIVYSAIYYADDEFLIGQHAYGVPVADAPVLHLRQVGDGDIASVYLATFADVWAGARSLDL